MKHGLIKENDVLVYYVNDVPVHAGAIKENGAIYYIGRGGIAVTGQHVVHREMSNGLLERGTYIFGEDCKLIDGSYIPPIKKKKQKKQRLSRNKLNFKKRVVSKQQKKSMKIIFGSLAILLLIMAFAFWHDFLPIEPNDHSIVTPNDQEIQLPVFEDEVFLCSKGVQGILEGNLTIAEAIRYGTPYKALVFEFNLRGNDGLLLISENEDMSNATEFFLNKGQTSLNINNLKTGTQYFYTVIVNGKKYEGLFKTATSTRFIQVDGIFNTRDIGGYVTLDGRLVKQGMIIRGSEMDGLVEPGYRLSDEGIQYMNDTFGFAYDMDLRAANLYYGDYTSYLGNDINHKFYTAPQYGQIFSSVYKESLRQIFSDLAKPENYPMYLHCTYGADRTGTIVFLLQGVLNMPMEQMISEYQMTGFSISSYADSENMEIIISGLQNKEGDTLQEKIVNFLIDDVGVSFEEIESIRNILLQ